MSKHGLFESDDAAATAPESEAYAQSRFSGRFKSDSQERKYLGWFAGYMLQSYRLGVTVTAFGVPLLLLLIWILKPGQEAVWATVICAAIIVPAVVIQSFLVTKRKQQAAVSGAALLAGVSGLAMVLALDLPLQLPILATMIMLFQFSYFVPLRPNHSLLVMPLIAIPHIGLSIYAHYVGTLDGPMLTIVLFCTATSTVLVLIGGFSFHQFIRKSFVQQQVIAAQSVAIEREKDRADGLLLNILPAPIAERLKREPGQIAEHHDEVTILFCDIVGFTSLSERLSAAELVTLLDRIVSRFDALAKEHGIEKIKTIGDAYMAVAGLPEHRDDHAEAAARMALAMPEVVSEIGAELCPDLEPPLSVRVGLYSGPVVAGVIGSQKFAYDLWGDSVNVAARMESHGVAGQVQIGDTTHALLSASSAQRFGFTERGSIDVKGKGRMTTWLLESRPSA